MLVFSIHVKLRCRGVPATGSLCVPAPFTSTRAGGDVY
jgi:hypothetical protein